MEISVYANIIWLVAILIVSLDLVIFMGSRNISSRIFVTLSFITAIWVISQGFLISTTYSYWADWLIRIQYVMGILVALGFYIFSTVYPFEQRPQKLIVYISGIVVLMFAYLYMLTDLLNVGVTAIGGHGHWSWQFGQLHPLFDIVFCIIWIVSLRKLYVSYKSSKGLQRINMKHMFWGLTLGIIPPSFANILLPTLGIYHLNWTGPIFSALWIFIIGYSIIKYRQMDVKVIITEVLAVAMTVIFFINIFTQTHYGVWENIVTFLVFLFLAIFLIRGVLTESRQREELRVLNETLEDKVAEKTQEVRRAFELEMKARRELEKLNETKDQFILITQHSLRSPLHSIRGGIEEIDPKTNADQQTTNALGKIQSGIDRLTKITDDFLAITAIKAGASILNLSKQNMQSIIEKILNILRFDIEDKNITVKIHNNDKVSTILNIDGPKIYDALLIVIENAIKYNVPNGQITFNSNIEYARFILQITDTGTGISKEDMEKISHNLFHRGSVARELNPIGMGIGLSVARSIIRAHHGEFTLESEGENCGTRVTISLPVNSTL